MPPLGDTDRVPTLSAEHLKGFASLSERGRAKERQRATERELQVSSVVSHTLNWGQK